MTEYESSLEPDELMHYGKKGMKWRVHRKRKKVYGNAREAYRMGTKDPRAIKRLSDQYGHQALNEMMKKANHNMGYAPKYKLVKGKRVPLYKEEYPWEKKR